ncbi:hypothetical protein, partial [Pseudoalteromonas sp. GW168-MNA-CIBAN-0100]|uniref:hypothetical protein n=1 Tax=Pseudoalteromonas sp. GW168-MNA-CIBAN-0100 TaxID=3140434 RepID=UPI003331C837
FSINYTPLVMITLGMSFCKLINSNHTAMAVNLYNQFISYSTFINVNALNVIQQKRHYLTCQALQTAYKY